MYRGYWATLRPDTATRKPGAVGTKGALTPGFDLGTSCCHRPGTCFYHTLSVKADNMSYDILCYVTLLHNTWSGAVWGQHPLCP
jgi:hypothetical protein